MVELVDTSGDNTKARNKSFTGSNPVAPTIYLTFKNQKTMNTKLQEFIKAIKEADPNITQEELEVQIELFLLLNKNV